MLQLEATGKGGSQGSASAPGAPPPSGAGLSPQSLGLGWRGEGMGRWDKPELGSLHFPSRVPAQIDCGPWPASKQHLSLTQGSASSLHTESRLSALASLTFMISFDSCKDSENY